MFPYTHYPFCNIICYLTFNVSDADWYELIKDAKEVDDATRRLAVLHFDWDNADAETIFLALESFLPPGACLEKVTVRYDLAVSFLYEVSTGFM